MKRLFLSPARFALRVLIFGALLFSISGMEATVQAQSQEDNAGGGYDPALFQELDFRMIGPSRGGRATTVAGHRTQPHTFYFGSTGGGVWKTTDYGTTWRNISDGFFQTASIGSIDVADSDPNILYVGTGSDGIRSNVIVGRGVYKSTDAGKTWTFIGLRNTGQIGAVVIHPTQPDVVYVAALGSPFGANPERGVYKTTDGGATWEQVLFVSDRTGAIDLELNPAQPDEVYAGFWRAERKPWTIISGAEDEDGIYKSTDGGASWTKLENGLPQGLIGKIDLAVSPADPDRVYALVEAVPAEEGLYRSDDRGETWRMVNDAGYLMSRPFYYTNVDADPANADVVYVNNLGFHKSTDGGDTFTRVSTPHGDNHDLWINPDHPDIMVQSNDGGANVTLNGGTTWSTQRNQPTAELYQIHVDDRFPYWVYAGQQDNSTIAVPSLPPGTRVGGASAFWEAIGGCETGPAVPRPGNPNIVYSNCKGRFGRYNRATGQEQQYYVGAVNMYGRNPSELPYRFQRVVPIEVSPHDPDVIYHASQYVHRSTDEGKTWETISPDLSAFRPERQVVSGGPITRDITGEEHYSVIYVVEESPLEPGVIWTGANDGPVYLTRDNGRTWTEVTPPDMPPEGRIQSIEPSPHTPGKAYFAGYRYLLNDWEPYIYRTTDYGETWTRLTDGTNGLPADYPTRVVREDPDREGLLYAGTEFGLFLSFDDGAHWQPFQLDLPVTPITDIKVHRKDLVLSTMGRSFWILDNLTPLHQLTDQVAVSEAYLFQPRDAYRMRYRSGRRGAADPEYPSPGVMIDYYLAAEPEGTVTLEILDEQGNTIRHFSSETEDERTEEGQAMRAPQTRRQGGPRLKTSAGMHRFIWNMQYPGPQDGNGNSSGRGPLAAPGTYQVRLTAGAWSRTQRFEIMMDPRVAADGLTQADLEEQLAFNLQVRDALSEARRAAARIESMKETLEKSGEDGNSDAQAAREQLESLDAVLNTPGGMSYPPPMLIAQLQYLSGMTSRADQRPGKDAYDRYAELRSQLDRVLGELDQIEQNVAPLNGGMRE
ncbi:MAG: hypothetical protein ACE5G0_02140 [Rhodothermales bacterium]